MKTIIITLLIIPIALTIGGIIKYNVDLNRYIKQETFIDVKSENKSNVNRTEVHIVGTVHFETDTIKRQDLYKYIDRISPAVILYEGNEKEVKRILNKTDYITQLITSFKNQKKMEKAVVLKYIENNPNCVVLPYEWELKNQHFRKHNLQKNSKKLINSIIALYVNKQLTSDQLDIIDSSLKLNKALTKIENKGTLAEINSFATDSIVEKRQNYMYLKIPEIVKKTKELAEYSDFVPIHMSYWDTRNKAMVQNILKKIKLNPNKVIVVLNGFYHRYYLIQELKKYQEEFEFSIKEI